MDIAEQPDRYSIWGNSSKSAAIYFSLPEGVDKTSVVEVHWSLEPSWILADLTSLLQFGWLVPLSVLVVILFAARRRGLLVFAAASILAFGLFGTLFPQVVGFSRDGSEVRILCSAALRFSLALGVVTAIFVAVREWRREGASEILRAGSSCASGISTLTIFGITVLFLSLTLFNALSAVPGQEHWGVADVGHAQIANRLPYSDAGGWFNQSAAVASGEEISWGARRPLHAVFRAGVLASVGGSYLASLGVQALLVSLGVAALVAATARALSLAAALFAWVILLQLAAGSVGSYLSEPVALAIACTALAATMRGWSLNRVYWRVLGAALFAVALAIRPGPMLLLAALPLSEICFAALRRWRAAFFVSLAIVLVQVVGVAAFELVARPSAMQNANAAHTLYGMAHGMTWADGYNQFIAADPSRSRMGAREQAEIMFRLAKEQFLRDPYPGLRLGFNNLGSGVDAIARNFPAGITRILLPFEDRKFARVLGIPLLALAGFGLFQHLCNRSKHAWIVLSFLIALVGSLPLIWGDGQWRGITVAMPILAVSLGYVGAIARRRPATSVAVGAADSPDERGAPLIWISGLSVPLLLLIGVIAFLSMRGSASSREGFEIDLRGAPAVYVVDGPSEMGIWGVPVVSKKDLLDDIARNVHPSYLMVGPLTDEPAPFLVLAHNPARVSFWIIVPNCPPDAVARIRLGELSKTESTILQRADTWSAAE
ncbi:MAG: hypothetical protein EXS10_10920 [Phycisphaerales bacterium]|nr:hypothetical protein [Phycisphaerales bacterium]